MANLTGSSRPEVLTGGAGADSVTGGAGNDVIRGDNLLANGTFEGNNLESGYNSNTVAAGWTRYNPNNTTQGVGQQVHTFTTGAANYIDTGNQNGVKQGLEQNTGVTYDRNQSYNFTLDVGGQYAGGTGTGRYGPSPVTVEIYVGTTRIGTTTYTFPSNYVAGTMNTISLPIAVGASAATGQISVRIFVESINNANNRQTIIDNASLTTTGVVPGGNDTLDGGLGSDTIYGDAGNDSILGGAGADTLYGGTGNDTIYGDDVAGTDTLGGADYIDGGAGNDSIVAGIGNDTVTGGAGGDTILGGAGSDTIYGAPRFFTEFL
ncbi:calcium-binding protein [Paracoccus pacificus]|uniref:Calcium-binding protein n=1 Tax=Paracoccus pacificus TaxID=1463598 RepID=A0ABW4R4I5_9RHOB